MASNYAAFRVQKRSAIGVIESVGPGVDVHVREDGAGADVAESPLTTDADGEIAAGSLAAVDPGTTVHFRVEEHEGLAGVVSQITTA